jgi:molybdenum cofactor synthesis domain-containing protein
LETRGVILVLSLKNRRRGVVRVEMLAVGRELLIGRTLDTNSLWIGERLARLGSMLKEVTVIDDDLTEIASALKASLSRSPDFVIVVGGLGPTPDDMTLKGIAEGLGVELRKSRSALEMIKGHYAKRGLKTLELTPSRLKMSRLPVGGVPLQNDVGTAPGVKVVAGRASIYSLPGVPAEMRDIFLKWVEPEIRARLGAMHRKVSTLKVEGILESSLAPIIARELGKHPSSYIKSHPKGVKEGVSRIELDVAVVGRDEGKAAREKETIVRDMAESIMKEGGRVKAARGAGGR